MSESRPGTFPSRLIARIQDKGSRLVVGIDPNLGRFPAELSRLEPEEALKQYCDGVLEAVQDEVAAVKPQIAFFEQYGWRGFRAFHHCVRSAAARGIPVIADCKRGDIGSTATAYAQAFLGTDPETPGPYIDALTVNPYLGRDSLAPFIDAARAGGRGLFILARTSNPGARDFQDRETEQEPLYVGVARAIDAWGSELVDETGYSALGLVCGATYPGELEQIRAAAPRAFILIPGLGAQGGKPEDLRQGFDEKGLGALPSSSRAVLYPWSDPPAAGEDWAQLVHEAARGTRLSIEDVLES